MYCAKCKIYDVACYKEVKLIPEIMAHGPESMKDPSAFPRAYFMTTISVQTTSIKRAFEIAKEETGLDAFGISRTYNVEH